MSEQSLSGIKFGTDGWRAVFGDGFTFDRAALVAEAINRHLDESGHADKPVVVGYDNRFSAENIAAHIANHLNELGRNVMVCDAPCPTPALAFAVKHNAAAAGVMLTASHNPYYYQGLKFIPHFAGPAMPEDTDRITELCNELYPDFVAPPLRLRWRGDLLDPKPAYFEQINSLVNLNSLTELPIAICYDAMHGTGAGYLDSLLKQADVAVRTVNRGRDVRFGSRLPDPSAANLKRTLDQLEEESNFLLIGTDGDADRFGILNAEGEYFSANEVLPLLAEFLIKYRRMDGALVRAVSTSHLIDFVAQENNRELIETPVGFKYVGNALREGALIGGEESGGISINSHIPEKDGILASLLTLELIATTGSTLSENLTALRKRAGNSAYKRIDVALSIEDKSNLFERLGELRTGMFLERKIDTIDRLDGTRVSFEKGSWILFRASGTEDLVRIYLETTKAELKGLANLALNYVKQSS